MPKVSQRFDPGVEGFEVLIDGVTFGFVYYEPERKCSVLGVYDKPLHLSAYELREIAELVRMEDEADD